MRRFNLGPGGPYAAKRGVFVLYSDYIKLRIEHLQLKADLHKISFSESKELKALREGGT